MLSFDKLKTKLSLKCSELSVIHKVNPTKIEARIAQNQTTGQIDFSLFVDGKFVRVMPYEEVLGIKGIDMLGQTLILKQILPYLLQHFQEKLKCPPADITVVARAYSDDDPEIIFALYQQERFVEWIDTETISF